MVTQVDFDSSVVRNKLNELKSSKKLPTPITDWIVKLSIDSDGDKIVWIWAYLEDKDAFEFDNYPKRKSLRKIITEEIREEMNDVFVCIYFRSANEDEDEDEDEDE